ncbi:uncharacterized protein BT62DRAFT_1011022 [Guyanagaster necrorhizus]|uniref:Uncharacterized protein n=1 Tax=Guyanagaster necrorhizus TaxID=856835 RepID=A0A9P8APL1_9AGAR|nr:uncharacterized protein BT62DRAFT_1011022 [Guyanagaster necrorhizus MCA 3950]KAG7441982.1 hypothetical protein BT62DRAFT_1011022 [Guyanagaster necrorhizus MCA 3950]
MSVRGYMVDCPSVANICCAILVLSWATRIQLSWIAMGRGEAVGKSTFKYLAMYEFDNGDFLKIPEWAATDSYDQEATCVTEWPGDKSSKWRDMAIKLMTGSNTAMVHITTRNREKGLVSTTEPPRYRNAR